MTDSILSHADIHLSFKVTWRLGVTVSFSSYEVDLKIACLLNRCFTALASLSHLLDKRMYVLLKARVVEQLVGDHLSKSSSGASLASGQPPSCKFFR